MSTFPLPDYLTDDYLRSETARHIERLLPNGPRPITESIATTAMASLAHSAFKAGKRAALGELLTTEQVAEILGIKRVQVTRLAHSRNVGWQIGRDILFRPEDVEALRIRKVGYPSGRPRKSAVTD